MTDCAKKHTGVECLRDGGLSLEADPPYSDFGACAAACASCFSLRAAFRVCQDLLSVFGFGFSLFFDGVVVVAMCPFSVPFVCQARVYAKCLQCSRT